LLNVERLNVESEARSPTREQVVVDVVPHGVLSRHRQLLHPVLPVAGGQIAEGESARRNCLLVELGFEVSPVNLAPCVLFGRKVSDRTDHASVFDFLSGFRLEQVPVIHPDMAIFLPLLLGNPSPLRHFRSSPSWR
jgi:hypothetical protein